MNFQVESVVEHFGIGTKVLEFLWIGLSVLLYWLSSLLSETFCQYLFNSWAQNSWKSFSVESKSNRRVILPSIDFLLDSSASVSLAFISFLIRAGKSKSDEIKFVIVASSVAVKLQFTLRSVFDPRLFCQVFFVGRFHLHVSFSLVFLGLDFLILIFIWVLRFYVFFCYLSMVST